MAHNIVLTWVATTDAQFISGYNIYRSTAPGTEKGPPINGSTPVNALTYTDTNVVPGSAYYYEVTAVSSVGVESGDSVEAHAVVPFAPPTGLTAVAS